MRRFPLIVLLAAIVTLSAPVAPAGDAPDPLAPLVTEEGREGTREALLTFTYTKTVDKKSHTMGDANGVGEDKLHDLKTVVTTGRATIVVQDRNYLELKVLKVEGPGGKFTEVPIPEMLQVSYLSSEPIQELGVRSYSRKIHVDGHRLGEHFAMNVWGKPDPRWVRRTVDTRANDRVECSAGKAPQANSSDLIHLSFSSTDPLASFAFTFSGGCDVEKEEWFYPAKWNDHHYAKDVPTRSVSKSYEPARVTLPSLENEKLMPAGDKERWTRVASLSDSALTIKATRTKTASVPPDGRFLGSSIKTDERLEVQITLDAGDYEILITPPEGFKDWVPSGGTSLGSPGDKLNFKGHIRKIKGTPPDNRDVAVNIEVTGSRIPGRCMNWPRNGGDEPDLKILRAGTTDKLKIEPIDLNDKEQALCQAHGKFKVGDEFNVVVGCYDYGCFGNISFGGSLPVRIEGFDDKTHLALPIDENENRVADAWERSEGVYDKNLPADWDDVAVAGQRHNGDGICLYERCRGFRKDTGEYGRLKCDKKYLFIYDPRNLLRGHGADSDFKSASKLELWFIKADQWTGQGSQSQHKRIVNFNHEGPVGAAGPRHRVDQHGLDLVLDARRQPRGRDVPIPPGLQRAYAAAGMTPPPPDRTGPPTLGMGWPDCLPVGRLGRSPLDKYQISYYIDTINNYAWTMGVEAMLSVNPSDPEAAANAFLRSPSHGGDLASFEEHLLRWTLSHELGHGVGAQHHTSITGGDRACYMRYADPAEYQTSADPFWKSYGQWPTAFCQGSALRAAGGCFPSIQVTDFR